VRYPIAIEPGTDTTAFGVVVPDLPGCFSAGDTFDEALANAEEAAAAWIDAALDAGEPIPEPSPADSLCQRDEFRGWIFGVIEIEPDVMSDAVERVNVTLPRRVLARIDAKARELGLSRSGYIARMGLR
jgi:predicted RNase H-like HicB family nuclease